MTDHDEQFTSSKDFRIDYETALHEFREIRQQNVRTAAGGREFILVPSVTARLLQRSDSCIKYQNDLTRLRMVSYWHIHGKAPTIFGLTEDKLTSYRAIFYILLDVNLPGLLHYFTRAHRTDEQLPLSIETIKEIVAPSKLRKDHLTFYQDFYDKQFEWRPMTFDMGMEGDYTSQIVPCYRRDRIQPERDGRNAGTIVGQNARIYSIEVPEELTGQSLRESLPLAKIGTRDPTKDPHDRNVGVRYQLALKTFPYNKRRQFDDEREIFEALSGKEGIIKYVGWYQSYDTDQPKDKQDSFTLVLELAKHDLYKLFREEAPPVTAGEIHGFWTGMLDIALALKDIHHDVRIDDRIHDLIHGDIKPENILRVADGFKLADPGEGRVQLATSSDEPAMLSVLGGTITYAAPEKSAHLTGKGGSAQKVGKNSDVWSLGCVFSVAATFLVLGKEGVLQYDRVRLFDQDEPGDAFHNGSKVLDVVTQWHHYLRLTARAQDRFTSQVLDTIDQCMLLPAEQRRDSKEVCDRLKTFLDRPEHEVAQLDSLIPGRIAALLQEIDMEEETHHERSAGIERTDILGPDTIRLEVAPPADEQLPGVKKKNELHAERLLPTAQRTSGRTLTVHSLRSRRPSEPNFAAPDPPSVPTSRTGTMSTDQDTVHQSIEVPTPPAVAAPNPETPRAVSRHESSEERVRTPFTVWQMQTQLEAREEKESLRDLKRTRKFPSFFRSKKPELPSEQSVRSDESFHRNSLTKDDPLETFLTGRDIVYIVDNGSSMWWYWKQVAHCMRILAWRSLGYDDDGMELYIGSSIYPFVKESPNQRVQDFTDAIQSAIPPGPKSSKDVQTDLQWVLNNIILKYMSSSTPPKPMTIIILTDGAWHKMTDEYAMDKRIQDMLRSLKEACSPMIQQALEAQLGAPPTADQLREGVIQHLERERPITIQFISFGHDKRGIERLNRLDDHLGGDPNKPMFPDLVDTEPAEGDVYKMFCGSLSKQLDHTTTLVGSLPSFSSLSPSSTQDSSSRDGHSRSDTITSVTSFAASEDLSPISPPQGSKMPFEDINQQLWALGSNPTVSAEPSSAVLRHSPEQMRSVAVENGRKASIPLQRSRQSTSSQQPPPQLQHRVTSPAAPPEIHVQRQASIRSTSRPTGEASQQFHDRVDGSTERHRPRQDHR